MFEHTFYYRDDGLTLSILEKRFIRRFQIYSTEAALPSHLSLLRLLRVHPGRLVKIFFQFDF